MTDIILKQGTGVPSDSDLEVAEVAIDSSSGAMYTKLADGSVKHLNSNGGGFVDAPNDGQLYGRQSEAWAVVPTGGGGSGNLDPGTQDGEILTWDTATANWTHDDTMIVKGGNVGIGPSVTPYTLSTGAATLTLSSDRNNKAGAITLESPDASVKSYLYHDDANGMRIATLTDHPMTFRTNNQDRVTIDETGNVGIGTDSPDRALHVKGSQQVVGVFESTNATKCRLSLTSAATTGQDSATGIGSENFDLNLYAGSSVPRLTIDSTGNVGIGSESPSAKLEVNTGGNAAYFTRTAGDNGTSAPAFGIATSNTDVRVGASGRLVIRAGDIGTAVLSQPDVVTIDSSGNVGIGDAPLRQASEAKEQLEDWKSAIEERMKAEPKADRSAVTQEITGFDKLPTLEETKERLERAAGDKLQVNGNISASGMVLAGSGTVVYPSGQIYLTYNGTNVNAEVLRGTSKDGVKTVSIQQDGNATFSGIVRSGIIDARYDSNSSAEPHKFLVDYDTGTIGVFIGGDPNTATSIVRAHAGGGQSAANMEFRLRNGSAGDITALTLQKSTGNAVFSGTVSAQKFVGDGSGLTNLPSSGTGGGYTAGNGININNTTDQISMSGSYSGTFTATDVVATSDERLKDNITTAPVGLIDSLKGREWDWKESGEKGSGVVAQELEQVLPHLVHEDEDGMKSVSYNGLVAYLIEELKDCRQRIAELEAKA